MRAVLLIAWREYKQYVLSRGFLIFLVMFPLLIALGGAAMGLLEAARPTRNFVVYDAVGGYGDAIDREIASTRERDIIAAWDMYLSVAIDKSRTETGDLPAPFAPAPLTRDRQREFFAAGGVEAAQRAVDGHLKRGVPAFAAPKNQFVRLPLTDEIANAASVDEAAALLRPYLLGAKAYPAAHGSGLFAAVFIPVGYTGRDDGAEAQFWSKNLTDPGLEFAVGRALSTTARRKLAEDFGLASDRLDALADVEAPIARYQPDKIGGGELQDIDRLKSAVIPAAMTYMLLVVVFGVGNLLLTNTIEERSNKIVEILLSSVTANELMLGKLFGIAAVGLTMPAVFFVGGLGLAFAGGGDEMMLNLVGALFNSWFVLIYLFYFFCAYAIFAMIFLAIGAVSNSLQDAQSYMGPVMLIVFLPLPFMVVAYQNPNGLIASILTWIPMYTPYAVMMRAAADPPFWEIVGATALMLAFAIVLARVMGRIFRAAILQSAPPKARDVWRLARSERDLTS